MMPLETDLHRTKVKKAIYVLYAVAVVERAVQALQKTKIVKDTTLVGRAALLMLML